MNKTIPKIFFIFVIIVLIVLFKICNLNEYLTLDYFQIQRVQWIDYSKEHHIQSAILFFVAYVVMTAISIPGAVLLTLLAGALFGLFYGVVLVSFASTLGATIAFLSSRFLLRDYVQNKFIKYFEPINQGLAKEGAFYLFTLRLIPAIPFFAINLVMGLTKMKIGLFFVVSQIGMLPATFLYVNAGAQLALIQSTHDILSYRLMGSMVLLGIFPLIVKKVVNNWKTMKISKLK